ncbi:MAG: LptF/LptG family permease [Bacteroidota bacterium]
MRLSLHILRAHIGPFLFSLFTLMFVFLLQFVMQFIDQLVGKGLSAWVIGQLIVLNLAWIVVLAVPMSVLVATLMAFGGLSAQNEITAMKGSGMSLYRMMMPVIFAAILTTYLLEEFDNKVLPDANHLAKTLIVDIRRKKPTYTIVPGLFSQDISGYSILVNKTFEQSNDLEGVTIYDYTDPTTNVVVTAQRGKVSFTPDYRKLVMDLENGEIHQLNNSDPNFYRRMRYNQHRIVMNVEGFDFEQSGPQTFSRGEREMSAHDMQFYVDSLQRLNNSSESSLNQVVAARINELYQPFAAPVPARPGSTRQNAITRAMTEVRNLANMIDNQLVFIKYNHDQINEYTVEIHKKYSIPVACFVFVFVGAPLGIMARRGTFGIAATLSLGFFLMYWSCLIGGEKLADRGIIAPWTGMWIANIILSVLGTYLTIRMARETPSIDWSRFQRILPKSWRSPQATHVEGNRGP